LKDRNKNEISKLNLENMTYKIIKLFLRFTIAIGFLSAVADRFGLWNKDVSVWGNWNSFLEYTELINPWVSISMISTIAIIATTAEIMFALCLIVGFKTKLFAKLSGFLLLIFALSMTLSTGIKGALDFSVYSASAGAFALSLMKEKYWELDNLLSKSNELKKSTTT
jgi:thiosulfate dehydrogenase (quinone) large subunit